MFLSNRLKNQSGESHQLERGVNRSSLSAVSFLLSSPAARAPLRCTATLEVERTLTSDWLSQSAPQLTRSDTDYAAGLGALGGRPIDVFFVRITTKCGTMRSGYAERSDYSKNIEVRLASAILVNKKNPPQLINFS
jgi:hypothetical protein